MTSKVEIANFALNILNERPIISFGDEGKAARVMSLIFDNSRDAVLRLHPWNFAVKRAVLVQKSEVPAFGFTKVFALPADYLRMLRLNERRDAYQIEHDGLLTDVETANLRYVARITDTSRYDPLFVEALAAYLAAAGAIAITNSQSLKEQAKEEFREKLQDARSVDGIENFPEAFFASYFLDAFLGGEEEEFRGISPLTS